VYVAFVTDVFARRIVGWRVSRSMPTELDALEPGSVGDSYDNALAETVIGSYEAEVIHDAAFAHPE
jgi:putative transposase